jgi:Cupin
VHGSAAEFCFIIRGRALVTITGLPQQDAKFRDPRYNLRRGENCQDEINNLWGLEDHYERRHKGQSNRHGGLRSNSHDGNDDDDDDHDSSRHSHSKKSGSKHRSSSGNRHDHSNSHDHDYYHSATTDSRQTSHFHSDRHSHKGRWWDEWKERNCTRTTESQVRYSETFLLEPGDAFVVPVGYHHFVEGIDESEPLVGLSILDSVTHVTFDTPQVIKALPKDVLTKSLGVPEAKLDEWLYRGKRRVYTDGHHFTGQGLLQVRTFDPDHLQFKIHGLNRNLIPAPHRHHHNHHRRPSSIASVQTRAVDANNHKVMTNIKMSAAYTELAPGAILEPYWVDNADELLYVIEGNHIEIVRSPSSSMIGRKGKECKDVFIVSTGYLAIHEVGTTWFIRNKSEKTTAKLIRMFNNNMPSVTTLYDAYHSLPWPVFETTLYR